MKKIVRKVIFIFPLLKILHNKLGGSEFRKGKSDQ